VGIFFEPKPVISDAEPELIGAVADHYVAQPLESYQAAYDVSSARIDALAAKYPVLVEPESKAQYTDLLAHSRQSPPLSPARARRRAARNVRLVSPTDPGQQQFQVGRFVASVIIFAAVAGAALGADAAGLGDSTKALYGFAASIFGVIVGLLGGESSS
jgi:hypothetical protein